MCCVDFNLTYIDLGGPGKQFLTNFIYVFHFDLRSGETAVESF